MAVDGRTRERKRGALVFLDISGNRRTLSNVIRFSKEGEILIPVFLLVCSDARIVNIVLCVWRGK